MNKPGHVLFLHKFFFVDGGVERVSQNLADGLQRLGVTCSFFVWDTQGDAAAGYQQLAKSYATATPCQRLGRVGKLKQLITCLREWRVDAIIAATETANMLAFACKLYMPALHVIYTRHSALDTQEQRLSVWMVKALYNLYALQRCTIVAVSKQLRDELKRVVRIPYSRILCIPNAVIHPKLFELAAKPTEVLPAGAYFCAVGRLVQEKGFDLLLLAYAQAYKREPELASLMIVGAGIEEANLKQLAARLGVENKVRFTGFVSNPYALMRHALAFVLSSRHEGMPTVMIEAMALGCPVIAFDCPTGPSELLAGGELGILVKAQDVTALAEALMAPCVTSKNLAASVQQYHQDYAARSYLQQIQELTWPESQ